MTVSLVPGPRTRFILLLASALGPCGCIVNADLGRSTEGDSDGPGASNATDPADSDASPGVSATDTGASSADTTPTDTDPSDETTGDPPSFACPPEPFEKQCDLAAQDCPAGFRCVPFTTHEVEYLSDATICTPVVEPAVDHLDPCQADTRGCTDDCGQGDYCYPNVGDYGGLCLGFCGNDGDDAGCNAGELCLSCTKCTIGTCIPGCDPLVGECPEGAPTCTFALGSGFGCVPRGEGIAGLGEQCQGYDWCAPGLHCVNEGDVDGCDGLGACCTELCDLIDDDPGCSNPAHACITLFWPGPAPAGQEHVGVCALPEADPCTIPGNCPPPGIEPNVPWCSLTNEADCPDGGLAGFFNGIACEQTCSCLDACVADVDCPVPATGTATPECVVEPYGPGSPTSCVYSCASGEVCPDGMTCTADLWGDPICAWVSPADPAECI